MSKRSLLLHSVSYSGSWGQAAQGLDDFVEHAAELGFDGVMLGAKRPHLSMLDYGDRELAALGARIKSAGLQDVLLAGYTNFTADAEHGEVPHVEFQIAHVERLARAVVLLGGRRVRVFTGYEHGSLNYLAAWNRIVGALGECAERAAKEGAVIGVQNHHDMACGWQSMADMIAAVGHPKCRAMFDAWAPALQGADLGLAARQMAELTIHTTVADYQLRPRYKYDPGLVNYVAATPYVQAVPMGEGFIDYRSFLGNLNAETSVAYEMCSPLLGGGDMANLDRYARQFVAYMRAL